MYVLAKRVGFIIGCLYVVLIVLLSTSHGGSGSSTRLIPERTRFVRALEEKVPAPVPARSSPMPPVTPPLPPATPPPPPATPPLPPATPPLPQSVAPSLAQPHTPPLSEAAALVAAFALQRPTATATAALAPTLSHSPRAGHHKRTRVASVWYADGIRRRGPKQQHRSFDKSSASTHNSSGNLRAVAVLGSRAMTTVSERFVCVALDWWPDGKCDYGRCPWSGASMLNVDLRDPLLLSAARRLSPFLLRLGGSLADHVTYEESDGCVPEDAEPSPASAPPSMPSPPSVPPSLPTKSARRCKASCSGFTRDDRSRVGFRDGCLSMARWDALADFCRAVGCELVFSVNALRGRRRATCKTVGGADVKCRTVKPVPPCCSNYTGSWQADNAAALLRRAALRGDPLAAVAFGNELGGHLAIAAKLSARDYAQGLGELQRVVDTAWRGSSRAAPLVVGPNAQLDEGWVVEMQSASDSFRLLL